ncbi:MAG: mandelate racemase/muconate lactonizing enzyme family protein [Pikeienuella sp.]
MKLTALETFTTSDVGFVRATAEDGSIGWGQVSTYNADITCQILHRQVAPWMLGADISLETGNLDDLLDLVTDREHKFPGSYLRRAMAGVDTAIWDLRGRVAEKPVAALLGGSAGPLRAYASSMKRDITPEAEAARLVRLADRDGFSAFKVRAGSEVGRGRDEWPGRTEAIIPAIRKALPGADLLIDANSCYAPAQAIEVGRRLQDNGYRHFEEPCPYWELEQTKEVADALEIDVTGGEQDCDLTVWRRMIAMPAVDVVQPDILYLGGICRTLRVVGMAKAAGLPVTPHCANLSMVTLFTMHLLRAIPDAAGPYLEFSIEGPDYYPWQEGLFSESPYEVSDGHVRVSDAPGWGVEIAPEWLARSSYRVSAI